MIVQLKQKYFPLFQELDRALASVLRPEVITRAEAYTGLSEKFWLLLGVPAALIMGKDFKKKHWKDIPFSLLCEEIRWPERPFESFDRLQYPAAVTELKRLKDSGFAEQLAAIAQVAETPEADIWIEALIILLEYEGELVAYRDELIAEDAAGRSLDEPYYQDHLLTHSLLRFTKFIFDQVGWDPRNRVQRVEAVFKARLGIDIADYQPSYDPDHYPEEVVELGLAYGFDPRMNLQTTDEYIIRMQFLKEKYKELNDSDDLDNQELEFLQPQEAGEDVELTSQEVAAIARQVMRESRGRALESPDGMEFLQFLQDELNQTVERQANQPFGYQLEEIQSCLKPSGFKIKQSIKTPVALKVDMWLCELAAPKSTKYKNTSWSGNIRLVDPFVTHKANARFGHFTLTLSDERLKQVHPSMRIYLLNQWMHEWLDGVRFWYAGGQLVIRAERMLVDEPVEWLEELPVIASVLLVNLCTILDLYLKYLAPGAPAEPDPDEFRDTLIARLTKYQKIDSKKLPKHVYELTLDWVELMSEHYSVPASLSTLKSV
jgi:hypothetical protein